MSHVGNGTEFYEMLFYVLRGVRKYIFIYYCKRELFLKIENVTSFMEQSEKESVRYGKCVILNPKHLP